jgi:hypothetical protein
LYPVYPVLRIFVSGVSGLKNNLYPEYPVLTFFVSGVSGL